MDKMKIREVIVVEGKDDTKRINMAVNADTLETRGSAISDETLEQIEELQEKRGVIVFTDPDFSGEKIRKIIQEAVPGVKHAFLNRRDAVPDHKGSLGVEHASPEATGGKQRPTYGAFLRIHPVEQRCFQFLILRQYRRPKPPAQQGIGNGLDTDTFLSIVQSDTVSVDVVAALMHQPPRSAVLAVIHDGDRFRLIVLHK